LARCHQHSRGYWRGGGTTAGLFPDRTGMVIAEHLRQRGGAAGADAALDDLGLLALCAADIDCGDECINKFQRKGAKLFLSSPLCSFASLRCISSFFFYSALYFIRHCTSNCKSIFVSYIWKW